MYAPEFKSYKTAKHSSKAGRKLLAVVGLVSQWSHATTPEQNPALRMREIVQWSCPYYLDMSVQGEGWVYELCCRREFK